MLETSGWADGATADVTVDTDWDEFDHLGIVAGWADLPSDVPIDRREFQKVFEAATASWTAGEGAYDESWAGFAERTRAAFDRVVARAGSGRTVVVVTSGGVIGALAAHLVDPDDTDAASLARRWSRMNAVMANSSVTRVLVGATGARLLTFNEHGHVEGDLLTYR
jgi:broad specificity phosphatase PhoE